MASAYNLLIYLSSLSSWCDRTKQSNTDTLSWPRSSLKDYRGWTSSRVEPAITGGRDGAPVWFSCQVNNHFLRLLATKDWFGCRNVVADAENAALPHLEHAGEAGRFFMAHARILDKFIVGHFTGWPSWFSRAHVHLRRHEKALGFKTRSTIVQVHTVLYQYLCIPTICTFVRRRQSENAKSLNLYCYDFMYQEVQEGCAM